MISPPRLRLRVTQVIVLAIVIAFSLSAVSIAHAAGRHHGREADPSRSTPSAPRCIEASTSTCHDVALVSEAAQL